MDETTSRVLTESSLREAAGDLVFDRGVGYVHYVQDLSVSPGHARASVHGHDAYQVELDWSADPVHGACTCPFDDHGTFCKHLVAVGLAAIDIARDALSVEQARVVRTYIDGLDAEGLRSLLHGLAEDERNVHDALYVRASVLHVDDAQAAVRLEADVEQALRACGFIDYQRSTEVATEAENLLDDLKAYLDAGSPDVARPALLTALNGVLRLSQHADDSSGTLGEACQRALHLYARACCDGSPDRTGLARWLVAFREQSPGWPTATLADFVAAFDEAALSAYRDAVQTVHERACDSDDRDRFEIDRMRLEIADYDGDIDVAIGLLGQATTVRYGAIVHRLRGAGRDGEALDWMDRAAHAGRLSRAMGSQGREYWLDPRDVAPAYVNAGRIDDARSVLRNQLLEVPGASAFAELVEFGDALGSDAEEREWALATLRDRAGDALGDGSALVEVALSEGDLDAARAASAEFGPGHQWQQLAEALADQYPREAAELHIRDIAEDLRRAKTRSTARSHDAFSWYAG